MGKHSKPRKLPSGPVVAAALIPIGIVAAAVGSTDSGGARAQRQDVTPAAQASGLEQATGSEQNAGLDGARTVPASIANRSTSPHPMSRQAATSALATFVGPDQPDIVVRDAHPDASIGTAHTPAAAAPTAPLPHSVTDGQVPDNAYKAYLNAADILARQMPQCGITWQIIAGIGSVESKHAFGAATDASGRLIHPIYGPRLDGTLADNEVIHDTDGGQLDGDPVYDRAVGPTQFLPATWKEYAEDGNGDGIADPQNIYDATLTTGHYLCSGNLNLRDAAQQVTAVLRYNNSSEYVNDVLGFARSY